jgi:hypothetical protein
MMQVLRDVLIEAGEIDRYFEGVAPVTLWRAKRRDQENVFALITQPLTTSGGANRPAEIQVAPGADGTPWVYVQSAPRGISTFDKGSVFKGRHWEHYRIEKGTELPMGLAIVRDRFSLRFGAIHYTIAPDRDMPLDQFKSLLRVLATRLIREVA